MGFLKFQGVKSTKIMQTLNKSLFVKVYELTPISTPTY